MILIHSSNRDYSTNKVIDWIIYFGKQFYYRLNGENEIDDFTYNNSRSEFTFTDVAKNRITLNLDNVQSYWYRRGDWNLKSTKILKGNINVIHTTNGFFHMERMSIIDFINFTIQDKSILKIGNEKDNSLNKLIVLEYAKNLGFLVPDTVIVSNKKALFDFFYRCDGKIITKAINESLIIQLGERSIYSYTSMFSKKHIEDCPEVFFPTLFQQKIEKIFELRIFYLDKCFYTTAIFSQNDNKTKQDFRNYNFENPNRTPPFNLPEITKKRIIRLMNKLGLKSGSIDMIYSKNREFVFLEVNPIGQFNQVSYPGNFCIEKEIAKKLCYAKGEKN